MPLITDNRIVETRAAVYTGEHGGAPADLPC